jgi:hypothetical protein
MSPPSQPSLKIAETKLEPPLAPPQLRKRKSTIASRENLDKRKHHISEAKVAEAHVEDAQECGGILAGNGCTGSAGPDGGLIEVDNDDQDLTNVIKAMSEIYLPDEEDKKQMERGKKKNGERVQFRYSSAR